MKAIVLTLLVLCVSTSVLARYGGGYSKKYKQTPNEVDIQRQGGNFGASANSQGNSQTQKRGDTSKGYHTSYHFPTKIYTKPVKKPAPKKPAPKKPEPKKPAPKKPEPKKPATKKPATKKPAPKY